MRQRSTICFLALVVALAGCGRELEIHDRPIAFSADRVNGTLQYIQEHYGVSPKSISIEPRVIVLHWTAIGDLESSFAAFQPEELGGSRPGLAAAGEVNVSIQFLVDRDGTVYRLMPETWMARHCIGLNYESIGIENVGGSDGIDDLTDEQIETNILLVRYLVEKYPTIQYLIGHMEYQDFEGSPLWMELDDSYRTEKVDPGARFMNVVRKGVADLRLEGPP